MGKVVGMSKIDIFGILLVRLKDFFWGFNLLGKFYIFKALDESNYGLMASLDLSAALDVVNSKTLLKRIKNIGFPSDVTNLIEVWLSDRLFFFNVDSP